MQTHVSPCEEFEVAALRRTRGALGPEEAARLAAHLGTCAACRAFAATAEATEAALRDRVDVASSGRDWDALRTSFRARRSRSRAMKILGFVVVAILLALDWWTMDPVFALVLTVLLAAIVVVAFWVKILPEARRARQAEKADVDLVAYYRQDLDKEIGELRTSRPIVTVVVWLAAALPVLFAANLVKERWLGHPFPDVRREVVGILSMALVAGPMWYRTRRVLPRLEREREELA
jgi:hypothetical protein